MIVTILLSFLVTLVASAVLFYITMPVSGE